MPTAQVLMDRAFRALGVLRVGQSASGNYQTEGLSLLNAYIDQLLLERLVVPQILQTTKTLTAGDGTYTVATGADIDVARPVKLDRCFVRWQGIDYPMRELTRQAYMDIRAKSLQSLPIAWFYDALYPTPVLYLYYVPDQAYELHVDYWSQLSTFALASTSVNLPPGYESFLWAGLAMYMWPFYPNLEVAPGIIKIRDNARRMIEQNNTVPPILEPRFGSSRNGRYNVLADR